MEFMDPSVLPPSRPGTSNSTTYVFNEVKQRRRLHLDHSIENKIVSMCFIFSWIVFEILTSLNFQELNETIIAYKRQIKDQSETFQVHIFKDGVKPKKTSESLNNGGIIALQVSLNRGYKLWKNILRIELDDQFQHNEDPKVFKLKNMINGISFILKDVVMTRDSNSSLTDKKVVLLKLWLQPLKPMKKIPKETSVALCHLLEENFDLSLQSCITTAKFIDNSTSEIYKIFS
ncbi:hypothetical protein BN7_2898 [Wickerhamomyces ciferrii]|uniref:Uncharacterized protein n=1 Tax=Wickerhamomyces ciferrii (strain ATCC 14091 / BCRC 22168 / CBS 111 / JCM 3599 / NBRC 0793 / NRRL Y-1031 F-60-10) TaxID=1206466 RepID=K0KE29_WICCF|nr:uncharacterized protein BN7_2898 [Wickerhamomyces ciferrii]CCH43350.1 hypothetical protein BN7_2898 [Wickerhamomyces ciferrii]